MCEYDLPPRTKKDLSLDFLAGRRTWNVIVSKKAR